MGAMRIGSRSVAAAEKKMESQERFRTVLSIIDAQIQSQVPLTYEEEGNKLYYFRGEGKTLSFCTNYSIWGGQKGYVIVDYKVDRDNTGQEVLYAGERIPGLQGRRETRLMMRIRYLFRILSQGPHRGTGKVDGDVVIGDGYSRKDTDTHYAGSKEIFPRISRPCRWGNSAGSRGGACHKYWGRHSTRAALR